MAQDESDLNLRNGAGDKNSGKRGPWLWVGLAVFLLLGGGAGAWWFLGAQQSAPETSAGAEPVQEEQAPQEAHYLAMDKLLVNFDYQGAIRYVQTELQLMAYSEESLARARHHMPAVRNRLIMLLSEQDFAALRAAEGKEALRLSILDAVNEVLAGQGAGAVDDVFFTSFVLQ